MKLGYFIILSDACQLSSNIFRCPKFVQAEGRAKNVASAFCVRAFGSI